MVASCEDLITLVGCTLRSFIKINVTGTESTATELYNFCSSCLMGMGAAVLIGVLKGCNPSTVLYNKNTESLHKCGATLKFAIIEHED